MNHRFLMSKEIERLFDETEMTVSEIIRTITREKYTGLVIGNKSRFDEISDEMWLTATEKATEDIYLNEEG